MSKNGNARIAEKDTQQKDDLKQKIKTEDNNDKDTDAEHEN